MPIGLLTLEIHIPDAQSLKDKRQVLRSLKDRLRAHYNVAVAELEHQELVGVEDGEHRATGRRRFAMDGRKMALYAALALVPVVVFVVMLLLAQR